MTNQQDSNRPQQGTGSSENSGGSRSEQKNQMTGTNKSDRKDFAREAEIGRKHVSDITELGGMSGRDDYAGGSGDDMSSQNTDQPTDR